MIKHSLAELYRLHTALNPATDSAVLDADTIVRLAAGEHLGERHDALVAELAKSPQAAGLYRLARDLAPHSSALGERLLAQQTRALPAQRRLHAVPQRPVMRVALALAAGLTAVTVVVALRFGDVPIDSNTVANVPAEMRSDSLLAVSFESDSPLPNVDAAQSSGRGEDPIFHDPFGT